ncbi:MAG: hypothetical protein ACK59A_00700 [Cyanobacteriota bacterium]
MSPSRKANKHPEPSGDLITPLNGACHHLSRPKPTLPVPYFRQCDSATWLGHRL